ncbi:mCG147383 [Mus musculus]|nr:mCG147383 [Mus musculus]
MIRENLDVGPCLFKLAMFFQAGPEVSLLIPLPRPKGFQACPIHHAHSVCHYSQCYIYTLHKWQLLVILNNSLHLRLGSWLSPFSW